MWSTSFKSVKHPALQSSPDKVVYDIRYIPCWFGLVNLNVFVPQKQLFTDVLFTSCLYKCIQLDGALSIIENGCRYIYLSVLYYWIVINRQQTNFFSDYCMYSFINLFINILNIKLVHLELNPYIDVKSDGMLFHKYFTNWLTNSAVTHTNINLHTILTYRSQVLQIRVNKVDK